jgi:hypothetical protein
MALNITDLLFPVSFDAWLKDRYFVFLSESLTIVLSKLVVLLLFYALIVL